MEINKTRVLIRHIEESRNVLRLLQQRNRGNSTRLSGSPSFRGLPQIRTQKNRLVSGILSQARGAIRRHANTEISINESNSKDGMGTELHADIQDDKEIV